MLTALRYAAQEFSDVFVPRRCAACDAFGAMLCHGCCSSLMALPALREPGHGALHEIVAFGAHTGLLRRAVVALKFKQRRALGRMLGSMVARRLPIAADVLVPVPLHHARLMERGFNQAHEIARGIAAQTSLPIADSAIVRTIATQPQTILSPAQRRRNVCSAFAPGARADAVRGKRIALVDDVMTTGATLHACANMLQTAGALRIVALVLARRQ
ncbi:MAG: ComF family protein [Candidatus Eremiobacteraeota bacterium]|nr:ComF family protein [Candidatus Eremiobacteraeota bacterium]